MERTKRNSIQKGLLCGASLASWISPLVLSVTLPTHAATSSINSLVKVSNVACTISAGEPNRVSFQLTNLSQAHTLLIIDFGFGFEKPNISQPIRIDPLQTLALNLDSAYYQLGARYRCDGNFTSPIGLHYEGTNIFGEIPITA